VSFFRCGNNIPESGIFFPETNWGEAFGALKKNGIAFVLFHS
jgi:hypothetical protein